MRKPILACVVMTVAMLSMFALILFPAFFVDTETASVPFKTNIEQGLKSGGFYHEVESASKDSLREAQKDNKKSTVPLEDKKNFFGALPISSEEIVHKTFISRSTRGVRILPRHVYWFRAIGGEALIVYEDIYNSPPAPLEYEGKKGFFKQVESDQVVFKYSKPKISPWITSGAFGAILLMIIVFAISSLPRGSKKSKEDKTQLESAEES